MSEKTSPSRSPPESLREEEKEAKSSSVCAFGQAKAVGSSLVWKIAFPLCREDDAVDGSVLDELGMSDGCDGLYVSRMDYGKPARVISSEKSLESKEGGDERAGERKTNHEPRTIPAPFFASRGLSKRQKTSFSLRTPSSSAIPV